jgi:hypothetical protein
VRHPDPETLALGALGEDVLADDARAHVLACETCHGEVESLRRAVDAVRGTAPAPRESFEMLPEDAAAPPPPPRVWRGVAAELGLERPEPGTARADTRPAARLAGPARPLGPGTRHDRSSRPHGGAPPSRPPAGRRGRRGLQLLATAAVAVLAAALGSAGTAWWLGRTGDTADQRVVLAASLTAEPEVVSGSGTAEIVQAESTDTDAAGEPALRLTLDELPEVPGYHGVWLIDPDTGEMVSLGVLPGEAGAATGTFRVPPGLDLTTYRLVDVSDEPLDGDPAHSGVSLLRGTLAAPVARDTA